jgi:hypothetical protein
MGPVDLRRRFFVAGEPCSPNARKILIYVIKKWETGTHFHEQKQHARLETNELTRALGFMVS